MPNIMVIDVFKSISQGLFASCTKTTVSLGACKGRETVSLRNGAIDCSCCAWLRTTCLVVLDKDASSGSNE